VQKAAILNTVCKYTLQLTHRLMFAVKL